MATLDVAVRKVANMQGAAVVDLTGAIDTTTVVEFQDKLEALKGKGQKKLVLNLEGIKYVNSTGLGSLVKFADSFANSGGGIMLAKVPPKVKVVFEMLGLHAFFKIYSSEEAAVGALNDMGKEPPVTEATIAEATAPTPAPTPMPATAPTPAPVPEETAGFPLVAVCTGCKVELQIPRPGNYKCPRCASIVSVAKDTKTTFLARKKPTPIQMSLACTKECKEGFQAFIRIMASTMSMAAPSVDELVEAIGELCDDIAKYAYKNDPSESYNILVVSRDKELIIKMADHGETFGKNGAAPSFDKVNVALDSFEHHPHPRGGNVLTMIKKAD